MEFYKKNKKVILISFAGVLCFSAIYWFMFKDDADVSDQDFLVTQVSVSPGDLIVGRELLGLLSRLRITTLDTEFFDRQDFLSLQDFSREITAQPVGRENPFAPFERVSPGASETEKVSPSAF
ncbi:MAG: hypothetical protein Q8P52_03055 [bacterium]|nr:hypothetical protein [bacterium]